MVFRAQVLIVRTDLQMTKGKVAGVFVRLNPLRRLADFRRTLLAAQSGCAHESRTLEQRLTSHLDHRHATLACYKSMIKSNPAVSLCPTSPSLC